MQLAAVDWGGVTESACMQDLAASGAPMLPALVPDMQPAVPVWVTDGVSGADGAWAMHVLAAAFVAREGSGSDGRLPPGVLGPARVTLVDTTLWCGSSLESARPLIADARRAAVYEQPIEGFWPTRRDAGVADDGHGGGSVRATRGGVIPEAAAATGLTDSGQRVPGAAAGSGSDSGVASTWPVLAVTMGIAIGMVSFSSSDGCSPHPGDCVCTEAGVRKHAYLTALLPLGLHGAASRNRRVTSTRDAVLISAVALVAILYAVRHRPARPRWQRLRSDPHSHLGGDSGRRDAVRVAPVAPRYVLPFQHADRCEEPSALLRSAATDTRTSCAAAPEELFNGAAQATLTAVTPPRAHAPPTPDAIRVNSAAPTALTAPAAALPPLYLSPHAGVVLRHKHTTGATACHTRRALLSTSPFSHSSSSSSGSDRGAWTPRSHSGQRCSSLCSPAVPAAELPQGLPSSSCSPASLHLPHALTAPGSLLGALSILTDARPAPALSLDGRADIGPSGMLHAVRTAQCAPSSSIAPTLGSRPPAETLVAGAEAALEDAGSVGGGQRYQDALARVLGSGGGIGAGEADTSSGAEAVDGGEPAQDGEAQRASGVECSGGAGAAGVVARVRGQVRQAVAELEGTMHEEGGTEYDSELRLFEILGAGGFGTVYHGAPEPPLAPPTHLHLSRRYHAHLHPSRASNAPPSLSAVPCAPPSLARLQRTSISLGGSNAPR